MDVRFPLRPSGTWLLACLFVTGCKCDSGPSPVASAPGVSASPAPSASALPKPADSIAPDSRGVTRLEARVTKGDELGYAVGLAGERIVASAYKRRAASGDGTRAQAGSEPNDEPESEEAASRPGSIFVFAKQGAAYALEVELVADKSRKLGNALAFDGTTLAAGAMFDDGAAAESGAVYVATRGDAGWSKLEKLKAPGGKQDDSFGIGVVLAGETLVATNTREVGGSLFAFERKKAGFRLARSLPFSEGTGPAETISASADVIAVGVEHAGKVAEQGVVRLYVRGANGFAPGDVLEAASPVENGHFGSGVSVEKSAIAVASESEVTLFQQKDGRWLATSSIVPPLSGLAYAHLALGDGLLALGFPQEDDGRVLVYRRHGESWKLERHLRAPDGQKEDWFGAALALEGKRLVVGAPLKDARSGAVYVVDL